ncbi:hypothetical protein [Mariniphaga sp.]|uniref:hypothetical protein n=1 Tax=Mariniphaga sp. TaxID=1954475 RepID=UPI003565361E
MDHIVYLDARAKELENLENGSKTMIVRGAMGRKLPYGRVHVSDVLYFAENNGDGLIKGKAQIKRVFFSEKLTKNESEKVVAENQSKLRLNSGLLKRFAGKRFLTLVEVEKFENLSHFKFNRSDFGNMDDWLPVENIEKVK